MKQKRKIKSLLPQKQKEQTYLMTTILLILSLVLCIGTAALITSSVGAANPNTVNPNIQVGNNQFTPVDSIEGEIQAGNHQFTPAGPIEGEISGLEPYNPGGSNHGGNGGSTPDNDNEESEVVYPVYNNFVYTGIDDKTETLYGIKFVNPSNLKKTVNNIFIQDRNLYISPSPVVVNPADGEDINRNVNILELLSNSPITGVHSHILGGEGNRVYADNITIIAGNNNKVNQDLLSIYSSWNHNALVLGGEGNEIGFPFKNNTSSAVSVGGINNRVGNGYAGVGIIGGSGNRTTGKTRNSFIIGGATNKIIGQYLTTENRVSNVIIGGKNVTVSGVNNIFVYSNDGDFTPKSSNAFYLNMEKGVGLNTTGETQGLSVGGAVYVGEVNIGHQCKESDYGIIGSYKGCLVGCTSVSSEGYHYSVHNGNAVIPTEANYVWEMLDLGDECKKICEQHRETCYAVNSDSSNLSGTKSDYPAQCTDNVYTGNAEICSNDVNYKSGYLEFYKNVIFETTLLDSDTPCPVGQENQCVYKCKPGFHLTGNTADGTLRCHRDCELPWDNTRKLKHNERIIAYNTGNVSCSNDVYVFPFDTKIISMGFPALSPTGLSISIYNGKATNGYSPETCGNYDHEKRLICQDGDLYLMKDNGQPIKDPGALLDVKNYKYESCALHNYSCNTGVYNLTPNDVARMDPGIDSWNGNDRGNTNGERGVYKLCKDYSPEQGTNNKCISKQEWNNYHYQLVACQTHYSTGTDNPYECKKSCKILNKNGRETRTDESGQEYIHGRVITGYKNNSVTCTDTCEGTRIVCDDGEWKLGNNNGNTNTEYKYDDCILKNQTCTGYNVTSGMVNQWSGTSNYKPCDLYNAEGKYTCNKVETKYKLTGCKTGYHANYNKTYCEKNISFGLCPNKPESHAYWVRESGYVSDYTWSNIFGMQRLDQGKYILWRDPNCAWDGPHSTCRKSPYPSNACEWKCDSGYHKNSRETACEENKCTGSTPTGTAVILGDTQPSGSGDLSRQYITGAYITESVGACKWGCKDGYHRSGRTCTLNECRYCANNNPTNIGFPYCFPIDFRDSCRENDYYYEYYSNN